MDVDSHWNLENHETRALVEFTFRWLCEEPNCEMTKSRHSELYNADRGAHEL